MGGNVYAFDAVQYYGCAAPLNILEKIRAATDQRPTEEVRDCRKSTASGHRHKVKEHVVLSPALPQTLIVLLNFSGKGQVDRNTPKNFNRTIVPTSLTAADLGVGAGCSPFELTATFSHIGKTYESGHWISYCKIGPLWYRIDKNESNVVPIDDSRTECIAPCRQACYASVACHARIFCNDTIIFVAGRSRRN